VTATVLIAGVGNIFLGDDGFGSEVAGRLARADLPGWVQVVDYGIRGMHLAFDLANADGYETTILVDATPRGGEPGTIYVIEPDLRPRPRTAQAAVEQNPLFNAHGMQPDVVFGMLDMLGAQAGRVLVVGCEPASVADGIGLSEPVAAAVDEAVRVVLDLATRAGPGGQEPGAGQERAGGQEGAGAQSAAAVQQDPQSTVSDTRR
jgi:hydrogenase maturation protease